MGMTYDPDLASAVQMLAADNARLCDRLLAAETALTDIKAIVARYRSTMPTMVRQVTEALDGYNAGKPS